MNSTKTQLYRVIATTTTGFVDPKVDTIVKWEGTDTDKLSRAYPPSDVMFADPLFQKEIENGFIITRFTFERQLEDGSWEKTDDPRRRLTPITDLERAIDAENRRDFPGDYITADCENCGDHGCQYCDDLRPVCGSCNDYGCAKCDPNWCSDCNNEGCAKCMPDYVCPSCHHWCDPQYESLGKESGICQSCEYKARLCTECKDYPSDGEDKHCSNCRFDLAPKCGDCQQELRDGDDGLGSFCRAYNAIPRCMDCNHPHVDPNMSNDDICKDCEHYWTSHYVWWRRALRKLRLMK